MNVIELVKVMNVFHYSVVHEVTGDHAGFADKLGVSKSTLYNMINDLRAVGIDIRYSRQRRTYFYTHPDDVEIILCIRQSK